MAFRARTVRVGLGSVRDEQGIFRSLHGPVHPSHSDKRYATKLARTRAWVRKKLEALAGRPRPDCCEVCHAPPSGKKKSICFDHNHGNDEFRGWLCGNCNAALGSAGDNPFLLRALAVYLETNGCTPTRPVIR